MSSSRDSVGLAEQASQSRLSITASLRYRASSLLGRGATANPVASNDDDDNNNGEDNDDSTAYQNPQTLGAHPLKNRRDWFRSLGARLHRHRHVILASSESSHGVQLESEENAHAAGLPSSSETTPSLSSPARRRSLRGRLRLSSLPARFRRRATARFSRPSSLSDSDKENFLAVAVPPPRPRTVSNPGSWSSFRSGVQRAVREVVDGNFRFFEDRSSRSVELSRPAARPLLRTVWTITSADSSDGQDHGRRSPPGQPDQTAPPAPQTPETCQPGGAPRSPPSTPAETAVAPSTGGSDAARPSPGRLTRSGSTVDPSPVVTPASPSTPPGPPSRASVAAAAEMDGERAGRGDEDAENTEEAAGGRYVRGDGGGGGGGGGGREWTSDGRSGFGERRWRGVVVDGLLRGMGRTRAASPAGGFV
ncbi:hypothetical protein VTH06DRAFT_2161 [Thermothelomyces fergusii]